MREPAEEVLEVVPQPAKEQVGEVYHLVVSRGETAFRPQLLERRVPALDWLVYGGRRRVWPVPLPKGLLRTELDRRQREWPETVPCRRERGLVPKPPARRQPHFH